MEIGRGAGKIEVEPAAENVVSTMTVAALSNVDLPSKDLLANLRNPTAEVRAPGWRAGRLRVGARAYSQGDLRVRYSRKSRSIAS
jgi:hypothetical protein